MLARMRPPHVEAALLSIRERAALVSYATNRAAHSDEGPDPDALRGLAIIADDIRILAERVSAALRGVHDQDGALVMEIELEPAEEQDEDEPEPRTTRRRRRPRR